MTARGLILAALGATALLTAAPAKAYWDGGYDNRPRYQEGWREREWRERAAREAELRREAWLRHEWREREWRERRWGY